MFATRSYAVSVAALATLAGCSALPRLSPISGVRGLDLRKRCRNTFPRGSWRVVHAITALYPGERRTALIGVVAGDSTRRRLRVAAVDPTGMTLLEAVRERGRVRIIRALPPFDHPRVADGLFDDIELLFLAPAGRLRVGTLPDGLPACRWREGDRTREVRLGPGGSLRIRDYRGTRRARTAHTSGEKIRGFARRVRLEGRGEAGPYRLELRLLRAAGGVRPPGSGPAPSRPAPPPTPRR